MEELPFVDLHTLKMIVKTQSIFRGYMYRQHLSMLDKENQCALIIQNCWKNYTTRVKLRKVQEVFALRIITKVVKRYKMRKYGKKHYSYLKSFDKILNFYPSASRDVTPNTITSKKSKNASPFISPLPSETSTKREQLAKRNTDRDAAAQSGGGGATSKLPSKKMKIVDLPPPWHGKDERRIAQSQKDDLLFEQKNNFAWAKAELMPLFWTRCSHFLDLSDDLKARNERYLQRIISCPFIFALQRCTKPAFVKSPIEIQCFPGKGLYMVASVKSNALVEIESYGSDKVIFHSFYQTDAPLFDAVISPSAAQVIGIDSHWVLHIFEMGVSTFSRQLEVTNKIPMVSRFLFFDQFGLLWVNLLSQGGDLYCCDPLTLHPTLVFHREQLFSTNILFKKLIRIFPVALNNQPHYFVATFFGTTDVIVFNNDFSQSKKLVHKEMKSTPIAKQCGNFLVVFSSDKVLYVYDLPVHIPMISLAGTIAVNSSPIDVCSTDQPPLFYVACEDASLHIYLSQDISIPLRIPENKLSTQEEISSANKILGPMTYTKSRNMFKEMRPGRFTSTPSHIAVLTATDKCSIILGSLPNGSVSSISIINDAQQIPAREFDTYKYYEPLRAAQTGCEEYNNACARIQLRRSKFLERTSALDRFDSQAICGQMKNIFYPGAQQFSLPDLILKTNARSLYSFIPMIPDGTASVYEVFHFLTRSGILSKNISSFGKFVERFASEGKRRDLTLATTLRITIETSVTFFKITDIYFDKEGMESIIRQVNPLTNLTGSLHKYTIAETQFDPAETSTSHQWLAKSMKSELTKMTDKLSRLEDYVKHELMKRVQESIDKSYQSNLLDKMLPISPIDLRVQPKDPDTLYKFDNKPNRNPMIEVSMHKTIIDQYSRYTLYGRDREQKIFFRALHVPKGFYQNCLSPMLEQAKKIAFASNKVSQVFYMASDADDFTTKIVFTEDNSALPLTHYLNVHSFLGGDPRLLLVGRSICCRLLGLLYQLHQKNIILRTLHPDNVLLNGVGAQVMIGTLFDSQFPEKEPLPLPKKFADPSNPFLPPEYFHDRFSEYTSAFDVWQFGIFLMYILTGSLPKSYGSELMKRIPADFKPLDGSTPDHILYPKISFFYDWLSTSKIVGQSERCVGERGECFIQTDGSASAASILEIEHYSLLPYKNTKLNYDESKLFLEIIAECLQVDPSKRPTVESLLRTYPFNQPTQYPEQLDMYVRMPNPDVFVSQFIYPILNNLLPSTFDITIGVLQALVFHDEDDEDDAEYSFPLDMHANSRVVSSLYSLKFLDQLVFFVLKHVSEKIQLQDVAPVVTFQDDMFDKLIHFFMRFVSSVEGGTGTLVPYTNETIMCLFSLYTANPYFRFPSGQIISNKESVGYLQFRDSAPLFVYCHTKVHGLIRYILSTSAAIVNAIKRTSEHDDWYFSQFLNFGEANFNLAHSLCYGIEKQKGNAIKTLSSMWQNGQSGTAARMFVDFRIFQKTIHCLHLSGARIEAMDFINSAIHAIQQKMYDPTFKLLWHAIVSPLAVLHFSSMMKVVAGSESLRNQAFEIIRVIAMDSSINSLIDLISCDVFFNLVDTTREPAIKQIMQGAVAKGNLSLVKVIMASSHLQKMLSQNDVNVVPYIDLHQIDITLDIFETLNVGKQLANQLFIYQYPNYNDKLPGVPPIKESIKFFPKALQIIQRESESICKYYDTQMLRAARFDLKETTFLKAKSKTKELNIALSQTTIIDLCDVFKELFKNILFFFRSSKGGNGIAEFLQYILDFAVSPIPSCRSKPHPITRVILTFCDLIIHTLQTAPRQSFPFIFFINNLPFLMQIIKRDYDFIMSSAQKGQVDNQVSELYGYQRNIRFNIFKTILELNIKEDICSLVQFIANDMLSTPLILKVDMMPSLNRALKFPIRDEALEMISYLLVHNEQHQFAVDEFIKFVSTDKFIDNERKLIQLDDNVLLVESSIDLIRLILSSGVTLDENFENSIRSLNQAIMNQYVRPFDPKIFDSREETIISSSKSNFSSLSKSVRRGHVINPSVSRARGFSVIGRRSYISRK